MEAIQSSHLPSGVNDPPVALPIPLSRRYRSPSPPRRGLTRQKSLFKDDLSLQDPPGGENDELDEKETTEIVLRVLGLLLCTIACPLLCRYGGLTPTARCAVLFASVLVLNLVEAMPLFCLALFIPVLGTLCQVLGEQRGMVETSTLLVANVFNNVSFLVLGALVINGIFSKCGLEKRFMSFLVRHLKLDSPLFLLLLMFGTMTVCCVLYSGSIMLLAALKPFCKPRGEKTISANAAKRLMMGVSFASNAGSTLLPISSPVNLIVVGLLAGFDKEIPPTDWASIALPIAMCTLCGTWVTLMVAFPATPSPSRQPATSTASSGRLEQSSANGNASSEDLDDGEGWVELTARHYFFIFVAVVAVLAISVYADKLEPLVGHPAIISLSVVVIAFGSGFLSRDEFLLLDWDLLAIVGGTNVMAFLVRETALGATVSSLLVRPELVTSFPFFAVLALLVLFTMLCSTLLGHTLAGVIVLPLVIAVAVKLQAPQTIALLCAVAIPLSTGLPHTSFDNLAAITASMGVQRRSVKLSKKDFQRVIVAGTSWGWLVVVLLGGTLCAFKFGSPPPIVIADTGTPEGLKPKVVTENMPEEVEDVGWNDNVANWKAFLKRPDKKAFAVGSMRGMRTRSWAAAWNHETQQAANDAALRHCETLADDCRLIYPPQGEEGDAFISLWWHSSQAKDLTARMQQEQNLIEEPHKEMPEEKLASHTVHGARSLRQRRGGHDAHQNLHSDVLATPTWRSSE